MNFLNKWSNGKRINSRHIFFVQSLQRLNESKKIEQNSENLIKVQQNNKKKFAKITVPNRFIKFQITNKLFWNLGEKFDFFWKIKDIFLNKFVEKKVKRESNYELISIINMGFSSYQLNYSKNNNNSHTYFCYYQLLFSFKEKSGDFLLYSCLETPLIKVVSIWLY